MAMFKSVYFLKANVHIVAANRKRLAREVAKLIAIKVAHRGRSGPRG
jgi:homoserine dehydrogenase